MLRTHSNQLLEWFVIILSLSRTKVSPEETIKSRLNSNEFGKKSHNPVLKIKNTRRTRGLFSHPPQAKPLFGSIFSLWGCNCLIMTRRFAPELQVHNLLVQRIFGLNSVPPACHRKKLRNICYHHLLASHCYRRRHE